VFAASFAHPARWLVSVPDLPPGTPVPRGRLVTSGDDPYVPAPDGRSVLRWAAYAAVSWERRPLPCAARAPLVVTERVGELLVPCRDGRLFRSLDGAATFRRAGALPAGAVLRAAAHEPGALVAAAEARGQVEAGVLLVSTDDGATWRTAAQAQLPFAEVSFAGTLGVALPSPELGELFLSHDGGRTWEPHRFG